MPRRHVSVNLLERAQATHRQSVDVSSGRVFSIRFIPEAGALKELSESVMRFREARLAGDQCPIVLDRGRWVNGFALSHGQELSPECLAHIWRGRRGKERPVGLEAGVVPRWKNEDRQVPTRSAYDAISSSRLRKSLRIAVYSRSV